MLSSPSSPRGQLLEQYVRARIITMQGIDIGHYDYDRHNALYYFVINADEEIFLRYGGREAESPGKYLNLESLELALAKGLELHELWRKGDFQPSPKPDKPHYPRDIEELDRKEIQRGRCVECHMIGDYHAAELEAQGNLDKPSVMFPSPDLETLGVGLDIPAGLRIGVAFGPAEAAGVRAGDVVTALEGRSVFTFADLQHALGELERSATTLGLTVQREGGRVDLEIALPKFWWVADIGYRYWSVDPQYFFESKPLTAEEKVDRGLPATSFACWIEKVNPRAEVVRAHDLEVGDILTAIGGVTHSDGGEDCELYIKLHIRSGDTVSLDVLRDGQKLSLPLATHRQYYRKSN